MGANLFSIDKAPAALPPWDAVIRDLGDPHPHRVARVLGVGRSTVYRWNAENSGPRVAVLALFWLTRWGRSLVDTQATNDAIMYAQLARSLGEERQQLQRQVEQLDWECRQLAYDAATSRLAGSFRGSAATAADSRTDMAPGALPSAAATAGPSLPLAWPLLDGMLEPPAPAPAGVASERRGSPAALPPAARSARCPAPPRSCPLPPSAPQGSEPWLPCCQERCQDDAIMASSEQRPACGLLELRQAQPAAPAPAAAAPRPGPSAAGSAAQDSCLTERAAERGRSTPGPTGAARGESGQLPPAKVEGAERPKLEPPAPAGITQVRLGRKQPLMGRAATDSGAPAPAPAADRPALDHRSAGVQLDRAARPERPASVGQAPHPAPRAPGAPPGQGVFSAIVTAATRSNAALKVHP